MARKRSGIYSIVNNINGNVYIGSSSYLKKRKQTHFSLLKRGKHHNIYLQNSWNKYGKSSFTFVVLEYCSVEDLLLYEETYLSLYYPEYNIALHPSAPMLGRKHTKETREKLRNLDIDRSWDEERKKNSSLYWQEIKSQPVHKYNFNGEYIEGFDTPELAAETVDVSKQAIINCCNGYCQSAGGFLWNYEKKERIKDYESKVVLTDEIRFQMGSSNRGKTPTGKWKESIIKRNKEFEWTKEHKEALSKRSKKPVLQYDIETGELLNEYDGVVDAAADTGLSTHQIYGQLYGKTKSILYYKWEYRNN